LHNNDKNTTAAFWFLKSTTNNYAVILDYATVRYTYGTEYDAPLNTLQRDDLCSQSVDWC